MSRFFKNLWRVLPVILAFSGSVSHAQITVTSGQTATQLMGKLVGNGVNAFNATLNCTAAGNGVFTATGSTLNTYGLDSGIVLTCGTAANGGGFAVGVNNPASTFASTSSMGTGGDADLNTLSAPYNTTEGCYLQFDFIPAGDTVSFNYLFGSEEYPEYACGSVTDAFGFFIKPASSGSFTNIAIIPGTTTPITINTVNQNANGCSSCCPGSGAYYQDNSGSSTLVYDGIVVDVANATSMKAVSAVVPCDTYTLKLAIADVGDQAFDSGVFLEAGSLNSVSISVDGVGTANLNINNTPIAVRNCQPANFVLSIPSALAEDLTIHYQLGGDAINGVDYTPIPDSVVLPAGTTAVYIPIYAQFDPTQTDNIDTLSICIETPYLCGTTGLPSIIGCDTIFILDTLPVNIRNNDTAICIGECIQIETDTIGNLDSFMSYYWTPSAGVSNDTAKNPILCPLVTTTYVLHSYITGVACDTLTDSITIVIKNPADVDLGPDLTTCLGTPVQLSSTITPPQDYSYSWTVPSGSLSDPTSPNPIYDLAAVGTFSLILTASPGAGGACEGSDTINIRVLPDDFNLYNNDTVICNGASVQINADADPAFAILWAPTTGVSNPVLINPLITPADTGSFTYTVTASYPTCPDIVKDITIQVEPSPTVTLGPDLVKCQWDTLQLHATITPAGYPFYTYQWTPDSNLTALVSNGPTGADPNATTDVVFSGQDTALIMFTVRTPAGCSAQDQLGITVYPGNFASLSPANDTGICPGDSVLLQASGGVMYEWTPGLYLNDSTVAAPTAYPQSDVHYTALVTDQYGCLDTLDIDIDVRPAAVLSLPDTVLLYPGDSIVMDPGGNCLYYQWFPYGGLSSPTVANPVVMPAVDTRYFVTASTEWGCVARDSVEVLVNEDSELDVPNAFAPGGSGSNKTIKPVHLGLASVSYFRIYNRWGTLVFSTADINEGWDGTHNGTPQPMGVYIYQVEGRTFKGRTVKKSGNITLLR